MPKLQICIDASYLNEINCFLFSAQQMLKDTGHKEMADQMYNKYCGPIFEMLKAAGYFDLYDKEVREVLKCSE